MRKYCNRTLILLAIVIVAAWAFTRVYALRAVAERTSKESASPAREARP